MNGDRRLFLGAAASMALGSLSAQAADFGGASAWLNTSALSMKALRGKVVLVNFWTYSCINSLRALPYTKSWAARYKNLVVIGVHTPEFSFEKVRANVEGAVRDLKIAYPVPMDSDYAIWESFNNQYWPAFYLLDATGRIRYQRFGEGEYDKTERAIQGLLSASDESIAAISAEGVEAAPDSANERSPETYVGYRQAEHFASAESMAHDITHNYSLRSSLPVNHWGLTGAWNVRAESAALQTVSGKITFRFHSRDLHLVMGPAAHGKPVRFRVTVDGVAPRSDAGLDAEGEVREFRLYQLIRQKSRVQDRTFEIEFLDPGVQVFVFTFG